METSTNPITKKLLIKPGYNVLLANAPANHAEMLGEFPDKSAVSLSASGNYDVILLFVKHSSELNRDLVWLQDHLRADTVFWIVYPKKSSGIETDLEMMSSWDGLAKYGYAGVAAAAIDVNWTALRFRPKDQVKKSVSRSSEIAANDYGNYIDVVARTVALPGDLKAELEKYPDALAFFQQLSFTNKKEYVVWVLSAKQEKTRADRVAKSLEKLLKRKKNPSEK